MPLPWEIYAGTEPDGPWKKFQPSVAEDVVKQLGVGAAKGTIGLAGMAGDVGALAKKGAGMATEAAQSRLGVDIGPALEALKTGFQSVPVIGTMFRNAPTSRDIQSTVEGYTGEFRKPQTTYGKYAESVGEFIPGAVAMPGAGGIVSRGIRYGVAPGLAAEAAGQASEGTGYEPYARLAAAVVAPTVAGRAITPVPIRPEQQRMVDTLLAEGVVPTAGQSTARAGASPLRWMEEQAGDRWISSGAAARINARQADQLNAAVMRRAGEQTTRAGADDIDRMFTRIGQNFDDLAARNTAQLDQQFGRDLTTVAQEYAALVPPSSRAPIVENTLRDIVQAGPQISGEAYQALRSRLDRMARGTQSDPQLHDALMGIRNALDDVMERSLSAVDQAAWRQARREYRNALVIERAATGAGSKAAIGDITPSQLRNAVVSLQGRRAYARGQGDFGELSRAAEAILKPLPQSGTAPRLGSGLASDVVYGTIARALLSAPAQAYLGARIPGQQAAGRFGTADTERLLRALTAAQAGAQLNAP